MKNVVVLPALLIMLGLIFISSNSLKKSTSDRNSANIDTIPSFLKGDFEDDYGIKYSISDSLFVQLPKARYYIIEINARQQYLIAKNGWKDSAGNDIYTRIDYMRFENMKPYDWGYCLTAYSAKTADEARNTAAADRQNPKKGCNGFPFSRMKKR